MQGKREKILQAALNVFSESGFHGCSIPELARKAGIATGGLYVHFRNKEALVNELYVETKRRFLARLREAIDPALDHRENFGRIWEACVGFAREEPKAFLFMEAHHHEPYLSKAALQVEAEILELTRDFVKAGQRAKAFRAGPPDVLISLAFGSLVYLFKSAARGVFEVTPAHWSAARKGLELALLRDDSSSAP